MKQRTIKLFLGGYINATNAQNISCLSIAKHIDKTKFQVKTLTLYSGNLEIPQITGVRYIKSFYPHRFSKYLAYLRGILWCDVAYLPKGEIVGFTRFFLSVFRKKSMSTVEGILDEVLLPTNSDIKRALNRYHGFSKLYSITDFLRTYNLRKHNLHTENQILYLGCDVEDFLFQHQISSLRNIILIGNDLVRKGIYDYLELAKAFPSLLFHIAGTGNGKIDVDTVLKEQGANNIIYHGGVTRSQLIQLLHKMDLHVLLSRSEGFPKVTLETACAAVPSVVYPDYGANEWITHQQNGFIVKDVDEAKALFKKLIEHPGLLQKVSVKAVELGVSFDWKLRIKDWEEAFQQIVEH